jgi:dephospho-CoA kinase
MKRIITGITGGIGSGKSAVRDYLSALGEHVICADKVSREIVMPGQQGNDEIKLAFGEGFFLYNGELDRKKLADYVFDNEKRINTLNGILHPIIVEEIFKQAGDLNGRVFIEAPLLIQAGMQKRVDRVWLVIADMDTRIRRVMLRDGLSEEQVIKRIKSQLSDEEMKVYADEIIDNSSSLEALKGRVDEILKKTEYLI